MNKYRIETFSYPLPFNSISSRFLAIDKKVSNLSPTRAFFLSRPKRSRPLFFTFSIFILAPFITAKLSIVCFSLFFGLFYVLTIIMEKKWRSNNLCSRSQCLSSLLAFDWHLFFTSSLSLWFVGCPLLLTSKIEKWTVKVMYLERNQRRKVEITVYFRSFEIRRSKHGKHKLKKTTTFSGHLVNFK